MRDGELSFDWGVNAAIFVRPATRGNPPSDDRAISSPSKYAPVTQQLHIYRIPITIDRTRSRTVTVPNVGGFAGASFRIENFKISAGYRADLFFGAMDGGIDTAKKENVGFYGPFASVSVGIGG